MDFELWVLIPIIAILAGTMKDYLKFRARQRQLGVSTTGLEKEVATLKQTNQVLLERVQNLEAIVVSQTWDALHDKALTPAEKDLRIASAARREIAPPPQEDLHQQRAAQLARRLQG
ncbi:MAG TPA: hypothetical protein VE685_09120 [Thermoanaerobaculia bacterium]|nr:hypothetical protein [Thermoanaerobaculia bacterium]